jgi:hypothetical protein
LQQIANPLGAQTGKSVFRFGQRIFYPLKSYNRFRQKHFGSIFGTAISQARNNFGHDNFIQQTLRDTISNTYSAKKPLARRVHRDKATYEHP